MVILIIVAVVVVVVEEEERYLRRLHPFHLFILHPHPILKPSLHLLTLKCLVGLKDVGHGNIIIRITLVLLLDRDL